MSDDHIREDRTYVQYDIILSGYRMRGDRILFQTMRDARLSEDAIRVLFDIELKSNSSMKLVVVYTAYDMTDDDVQF